MWVRSCDGVLVNLDRCEELTSDGRTVYAALGRVAHVDDLIPMFRGTANECGRFLHNLHLALIASGAGLATVIGPDDKGVPSVN